MSTNKMDNIFQIRNIRMTTSLIFGVFSVIVGISASIQIITNTNINYLSKGDPEFTLTISILISAITIFSFQILPILQEKAILSQAKYSMFQVILITGLHFLSFEYFLQDPAKRAWILFMLGLTQSCILDFASLAILQAKTKLSLFYNLYFLLRYQYLQGPCIDSLFYSLNFLLCFFILSRDLINHTIASTTSRHKLSGGANHCQNINNNNSTNNVGNQNSNNQNNNNNQSNINEFNSRQDLNDNFYNSLQLFSQLKEMIQIGMVFLDSQLGIQFSNSRFLSMFQCQTDTDLLKKILLIELGSSKEVEVKSAVLQNSCNEQVKGFHLDQPDVGGGGPDKSIIDTLQQKSIDNEIEGRKRITINEPSMNQEYLSDKDKLNSANLSKQNLIEPNLNNFSFNQPLNDQSVFDHQRISIANNLNNDANFVNNTNNFKQIDSFNFLKGNSCHTNNKQEMSNIHSLKDSSVNQNIKSLIQMKDNSQMLLNTNNPKSLDSTNINRFLSQQLIITKIKQQQLNLNFFVNQCKKKYKKIFTVQKLLEAIQQASNTGTCQQQQQQQEINDQVTSPLKRQQTQTLYSNGKHHMNNKNYEINENNLIINYKVENIFLKLKLYFCECTYLCKQTNAELKEKGFFITCEDISNEVQAQQYQLMNTFKMKLLASVSHKLRTPLNCSLTMLQFLSEMKNIDQPQQQMYILPALSCNLLMQTYINDICDYSQLEMGKLTLDLVFFNLKDVINECIQIFKHQADIQKITISLIHDEAIPNLIHSDPMRLRQVIINLLSNALKFSPKKTSIIVETKKTMESLILISIKDQGIGISQTLQEQIFMAWDLIQNDNWSYIKSRGTGLGLTISFKLVKALSGNRDIKLQSTLHQGSTFSFYIQDQKANKTQICKRKRSTKQLFTQESYWTCYSKISDSFMKKSNTSGSQLMQQSFSDQSLHNIQSDSLDPDHQQYDECKQVQTINNIIVQFPIDLNQEQLQYNYEENILASELDPCKGNLADIHYIKNQMNTQKYLVQEFKSSFMSLDHLVQKPSFDEVEEKQCNCPDVLIVDDESYNIYAMKMMLQQAGATFECAENGQIAFEMVERMFKDSSCCPYYKIILMDIDMPIKDGYEATIDIKQFLFVNQIQDYRQSVIIACSAYKSEEDKMKARDVGMVDFIEKPVIKSKLDSILEKYL